MNKLITGFAPTGLARWLAPSPATLVVAALAMALTMALAAPPATAATQAELAGRVSAAHDVLKDFNRIPEQAIPSQLLDSAYAVAVIPNVVKGGFIVGGSYGKGVLVVRRSDGRWSNPAFVRLANVGIGWQAGAQGSDLILVFKTERGVDNIARGKFTLGGSAAASAGPVGRTAVAATDGEFKSEIYTYARSRGLFAGVSVDGGAITIDHEANAAYYDGAATGTATRILHDDGVSTPASARPFLETLASMAPPLRWEKADGQYAGQPAGASPEREEQGTGNGGSEGAKTYAIEESADGAPETMF